MRGTCLVTGCAGFVGSHLSETLLTMDHRVIGIDNFATGKRMNMSGFLAHPGFIFVEGDIRDGERLLSPHVADAPLAFFHLAAVVSVPYSLDHPQETMAVNYEASRALLRLAERWGTRSFVFAGSAAEYGDVLSLPLSEDAADNSTVHLSPYGQAKYLASSAIGTSPIGCSLRCFNIYGPRQDPTSPYSGVISRFMDQALAEQPITVHGDGGQTRDFIFIEDVVAAYLLAGGISGDGPCHGIYNLGSETSTSIIDLARLLVRLAGSSSRIIHGEPRAGDIRHSLSDTSRLQAMGFFPRFSLEEGLGSLLSARRAELAVQS